MGCDQFPIIEKIKKITISVFICALYASLGIKYMQRRFVCRPLKGMFAKNEIEYKRLKHKCVASI